MSVKEILRPAFWSSLGSEDAASGALDSAEDIEAQHTYGALPLIVLTANDTGDSGLSAPEMRAIDRVWTAGHDRLAQLSSIGVNFVVTGSGHYIQLDRPTVVVGAIAEVRSQGRRFTK